MAMEEMHQLVHGLLIDGEIAKPEKWENLLAKGKWTHLKVVQVEIHAVWEDGCPTYQGSVQLLENGDILLTNFQTLWLQGWTSESWYNEWVNANRKTR